MSIEVRVGCAAGQRDSQLLPFVASRCSDAAFVAYLARGTMNGVAHAVRIRGHSWPFYAFRAMEQQLRVTFAGDFPLAAASVTTTGFFDSLLMNEVALPPAGAVWDFNEYRVFIVSSAVRALVGIHVPVSSLFFAPLFRLAAPPPLKEEIFYLVRIPAAAAQRCVAATSILARRANSGALRNGVSLMVSGAPQAKVVDALGKLAQPVADLAFQAADGQPSLSLIKLITPLTVAKGTDPTTTFVNAGDVALLAFDAAALIQANVFDKQEEFIQTRRRANQPLQVDGVELRVGQVFVTRASADALVAAMNDMKSIGEHGIMWPLQRIDLPRDWYLVRREIISINCTESWDFDAIHCGWERNFSLVRFKSAAARACIIAESNYLHERAIQVNRHTKQRNWLLPLLSSRRSPPECAILWETQSVPVIAVDTREARMKDDAFTVEWSQETSTVVLRCVCATALSEQDVTAGLASPLLRTAIERVASTHDGNRKVDMIERTSEYSMSYFHSRGKPRRAVSVTLHFDPRNGLQLVLDGDLKPTIELRQATIDVELSLGVVAQWKAESRRNEDGYLRGMVKLLRDNPTADVTAHLQQLCDAMATQRRRDPLRATLPAPVNAALLLLRCLKVVLRWVCDRRDFDCEPRIIGVATAIGTEVMVEGSIYRLKSRCPKPPDFVEEDPELDVDFHFFPNEAFGNVVSSTIHERFGLGLFHQPQDTFDEVTTQTVCDRFAALVDDEALRMALNTHPRPTRQVLRAVLHSLPHVPSNVSLTDTMRALQLRADMEVPEVVVMEGELLPVLCKSRRPLRIHWSELHLVLDAAIPAPSLTPSPMLRGTSALRKCEHLLAQLVVLAQNVDAGALRSMLCEIAPKLCAFSIDRRSNDAAILRRFLNDERVPQEWRRIPLFGLVEWGSTSVFVPAVDEFFALSGMVEKPLPLQVVSVILEKNADGNRARYLLEPATQSFPAWQRTTVC